MIEISIYHAPRFRKKLAIFDFDWTLIKPHQDRIHPKDAGDWEWLYPSVPDKLREYYAKGYAIIVVTNQTKAFKREMIEAALTELDLPLICVTGFGYDAECRKPNRVVYEALFAYPNVPNSFRGKQDTVDYAKSFYVGDAAGRPGDWSDSDREFAKAISPQLKFHVPEALFASKSKELGQPVVNYARDTQEIVVMVGYQGAGKSVFAKRHFPAPAYQILESDQYKSNLPKMLREARNILEKEEPQSVVFDGTFATQEKRAEVIKLGQERNVPVRCVYIDVPIEVAMKRNRERAAITGKKIPDCVLYLFRKKFELPVESEGLEVVRVNLA